MLYSRCLDDLSAGLANAGFSNVPDLYRIYNRYLLGKAGLCHLTFRVAANSNAKAAAIAHSLCARSGGMKTFAMQFKEQGYIDDDLLLPLIACDGELPAEHTETLANILKEERIKPLRDPKHKAFLERVPHVYTLDEMERLPRQLLEAIPRRILRQQRIVRANSLRLRQKRRSLKSRKYQGMAMKGTEVRPPTSSI